MTFPSHVPPQAASLDALDVPPPAPARWRNVKEIMHGALDRPPGERAAFLDEVCGGDDALRREVDSLLAASEQPSGFLESSAPLGPAVLYAGAREEAGDLMALLAEALGSHYAFARELGGGGMSRVFLAEERSLNREVVVKVLRPDLAFGLSVERFAREVRFAVRLQQANIVPVLSAGEAQDLPYYVMPYVRGQSLRDRIFWGTQVGTGEALGILKDIAKALAHAHAEGVVHRDIKPENVLFSGGTAVVTDFGIAKAISAARSGSEAPTKTSESELTSVGLALGTPAYMAPEQVAGDPDVDARADVYSFGVVAYELLAGAHPFAGKRGSAELMAAHVTEMPRSLADVRPELPRGLVSLVMRCLAKDPAARWSAGADLLAELESVEASAVGALAAIAARITPDTGAPWDATVPSVAVLPLTNLSTEPDNEYFSDGIAAEVLSALTRMHGLRVAAQTSSFAFKGQSVDLRTVADRLGVTSVLEGTVRRAGSRVRIAVQLVSASDGLTLWSERYDRELADIFALQDDIAQSIAQALERRLTGGEKPGSRIIGGGHGRRAAVNPDAFELYLRGRHLVEQRAEGMREALPCFEEAIRLDPEFSAPHAGIAMAFTLFGIYGALRPRDAFPRAREAAERALAIDPTDALALVMRAHCALWFEWDFAKAEARARRALELAPGLYHAHACLGYALAAQGKFADAIGAMERARALDPLSKYAAYDLAWVLIFAGRWEQAIRELQPGVSKHPQDAELRRVFGFCLFYAGRLKEARAEFKRALELNVRDRWASCNLGQALVALGEMAEARRLVREIEQRAPHEPIPLLGIAIVHHWLGDDDSALTWLERSLEARDYWLVMLRHDPSMLRLRGNARFQAVIQRIGAATAP